MADPDIESEHARYVRAHDDLYLNCRSKLAVIGGTGSLIADPLRGFTAS